MTLKRQHRLRQQQLESNAITYYVRPAGQSYGSGDGLSPENAFSGNSDLQANSALLENNILAVLETHTELIECPCDNLQVYGNDSFAPGIIDGENTRNICLNVNGKRGIILRDLVLTKALVSPLNVEGNSQGITNKVTMSLSGNQGVQTYGTSNWTHYNSDFIDNADDGISGHDDSNTLVYGCRFINNIEAIAMVNNARCIVNDVTDFINNNNDITSSSTQPLTLNNCEFTSDIVTRGTSTTLINNCKVAGLRNAVGGDVTSIFVSNSTISGTVDPINENSNYTFTNCLVLSELRKGAVTLIGCHYKPTLSSSSSASLTMYQTRINGINATDHLLDFNSGKSCDIRNCEFINLSGNRYYNVFRSGMNICIFRNNTIVGTGSTRGVFDNGVNANIENSLFVDMGNVDSSVNPTYTNCGFHNVGTILGAQTNSVIGDPLFIDAVGQDFRLGVGSPYIGAGANIESGDGIDTAIWGNGIDELPIVTSKARTAPIDIGAYVN